MSKTTSFGNKQKSSVTRRLRVNSEPRQLHGLINQLSVINLLTFKLRSRSQRAESSLDDEILRAIETAVGQANQHAEALQALSEKLVQEGPNGPPKKAKIKLVGVAHLTVVRAGAASIAASTE